MNTSDRPETDSPQATQPDYSSGFRATAMRTSVDGSMSADARIGANGGHGSRADSSVPVAGGGGTTYNNTPQNGQHGGVRIIWGAGRSYPSRARNI